MRTCAPYIVALSSLASHAIGADQAFIDVLANGERTAVVVPTEPGAESVEISVWLDRDGDTSGFYDLFEGWALLEFVLIENVPDAALSVPDEGPTDPMAPDYQTRFGAWEGRRPPSIVTNGGGGSFGGFRFYDQQVYNGDGSTLSGDPNGPSSAIRCYQAPVVLGGNNIDTGERLRVFRTTMDLSGAPVGSYGVTVTFSDLAVFIEPGLNQFWSVLDQTTLIVPANIEIETCSIADRTTTNANPGRPGYGEPDFIVDGADLAYYIEVWLDGSRLADLTTDNTNPGDELYGVPDTVISGADLSYYVEAWLAGCD